MNPANSLKPGFAISAAASVVLAAAIRARASALSAVCELPRTPTSGMVTMLPVTGSKMSPSNTPNVVSLLISATAAAPCRWPKMARSTRAQTPRRATTSLPVIFAGSYMVLPEVQNSWVSATVPFTHSICVDLDPVACFFENVRHKRSRRTLPEQLFRRLAVVPAPGGLDGHGMRADIQRTPHRSPTTIQLP